ncbi:undecaprenyl-diphosphate phosphatase [Legionella sp. W05-934-2]|jgi:undecaprenyl-diphosphatase|uniref:undecaprenyl-diphosphate phosphatase n=1 Tax=Legionella sp. W05-934-2 TaxID=1198649 RepID=UPI0034621F14
MNDCQTIILALVQGVTEFLPISSSAHLILTSQILHWPDQGLAFDVAVHFGTLFAVLLYFRKEIGPLIQGLFKSNDHSRLAYGILVATIPCALVGFIYSDFISTYLRSPPVIIATTLLFGLLLGLADWYDSRLPQKKTLTLSMMFVIGLSQILALIPGTSRSGITMTTGLLGGLSRQQASRFSFLLAIPIILLASGYEGLKLAQQTLPVDWIQLGMAIVISMLSAYGCIALFLRFIERIGFWPFVVYRIILAIGLAVWLDY